MRSWSFKNRRIAWVVMDLETIFNFFESGLARCRRRPEPGSADGGAAVFSEVPAGQKPNTLLSTLTIGTREISFSIVRHRRARRYLLRLRPDGTARVTIPQRGTASGARAFIERNREWLKRQLDRLPAVLPATLEWQTGSQIWFRGELVYLEAVKPGEIGFGTERLRVPATSFNLRSIVRRHLRVLATRELPEKVMDHASAHGLAVRRVTIRDQKSRWGSCSSKGTISLNWRLIQTPASVSEYVILHELAHLRHMNHSTRFWREVEKLCPDYRRAKLWLKEHQQLLH